MRNVRGDIESEVESVGNVHTKRVTKTDRNRIVRHLQNTSCHASLRQKSKSLSNFELLNLNLPFLELISK